MSSSKMVNDRKRSANVIVEAAETHAQAVGARLSERLNPYLTGTEKPPDFALLIRLLGRALKHSSDLMVAADSAHESEKADDPQVRTAQEHAATDLYQELVDFRAVVDAVYGSAGTQALGFSGSTPQEPIAIARLAKMVVDNTSKLASISPVRRGVTIDINAYIVPIKQAWNRLEQANAAMVREGRELVATQVAKNQAFGAYDEDFVSFAGAIETLCRSGGEKALSKRIRPSTRRPGRIEEAPDEPVNE